MSKKLRIAVPLCGLLAVAVVALFCVSGWAARRGEYAAQDRRGGNHERAGHGGAG